MCLLELGGEIPQFFLLFLTDSYQPQQQYMYTHKTEATVDWEIFVVKVICILNFHVKNISPPEGSPQCSVHTYI